MKMLIVKIFINIGVMGYATYVFITLELNPINWSKEERFGLSFFIFAFFIFVLGILILSKGDLGKDLDKDDFN